MSDPGRVFIDTNILVYCADRGDSQRRQRCRELVRHLRSQHRAVISTQVLQEFYVVATAKAGVDPVKAKAICANLGQMPTVTVTSNLIEQAIDCHQSARISFWDALVVVSARNADCTHLLTEDLNPGKAIAGVRVVHPTDADPFLSPNA